MGTSITLFRVCLAILCLSAPVCLSGCNSSADADPTGPPDDSAAPAAVSTLRAVAGTDTSISYSWTATGDDGDVGTATLYDFRYTQRDDMADDWSLWLQADDESAPGPAGTVESYTLGDLIGGVEYAAQLRVSDEAGNLSAASNIAMAAAAPDFDITAPAEVSDLGAWAADSTFVTVYWTASGDDLDFGTAAACDLRYSLSNITEDNWADATSVDGLADPQVAGTRETATVSGLLENRLYYFALKTVDDENNRAALSNVLSARTVRLRTWYVKPDNSGDAPTIRAACVDSAIAGDVILVAPGTYSWTSQGDGDANYGMIFFARDVTGFELRSEAGAEQTIIDAEGRGRVFFLQGITPGSTSNVTIDGFTITGGNSLDSAAADSSGGGLIAHLCSPIIRNCVFRGNHSVDGGGLWYGGVGEPQIQNCVFEDNFASHYGGGIFLINSYEEPVISNCVFSANEAVLAGGGVFAYHIGFTLESCLFVYNTSDGKGGGLSVLAVHPSEVSCCTFVANTAVAGGGIRVSGDCGLSVTRSIIAFNGGGAAFSLNTNGATLLLGCCDVFENEGGDSLPSGTTDLGGNFNQDPLFEGNIEISTFQLQPDSPCADGNHPDSENCGLIGAFDVR